MAFRGLPGRQNIPDQKDIARESQSKEERDRALRWRAEGAGQKGQERSAYQSYVSEYRNRFCWPVAIPKDPLDKKSCDQSETEASYDINDPSISGRREPAADPQSQNNERNSGFQMTSFPILVYAVARLWLWI